MKLMRTLTVAALIGLAPVAAEAAETMARHGLTGSQYQQEFNSAAGSGFRLTHVDGYATSGGVRYAAIWTKSASTRPFIARHGLSTAQFQAEFDSAYADGFRLMDVSATDGGRFAGLWVKGGGPAWEARAGMNQSAFSQKFQQMADAGFRMIDLEGYQQGGETKFAGIWTTNDGRGWYAWIEMNASEYQAKFNEMTGQGFMPVHVDGYGTPSGARYAAIFEKSSGAWIARHGMTSAQYQQQFNTQAGDGYSLFDVSGFDDNGTTRYAAIWRK